MGLFRGKKKEELGRRPQLMEGQNGYLFRRSRTLIGSISSEVKAAAEPSSNLQSPRLKAHRLKQHQRAMGITLFASLMIIAGLGWMIGQYVRLPTEPRYEQAVFRMPDATAYLRTVDEYFVSHPTERFLFHLDGQRLTKFVHEKHPEVGEVVISKQGVVSFDVVFQLRQPVAVWQSGGREVFVDKDGEVFYKNFFQSPDVTVEDQSGIDPQDIETVASNRFISFMGRLVDAVNDQRIGMVKTVVIPKGTTRQIDIKLEGRQYVIKTHIDRMPKTQAADIAAAIRYVDARKIKPAYLDARIAGKAYYR